MLQTEGESQLLEDEAVPFAPVAATELPLLELTPAERLFEWSQRWRVPLTLVFGALIAAAAFFAYETQQDDPLVADRPSASPSSGDGAPGDGSNSEAIQGAVEGLRGGGADRSPNVAPNGPASTERPSTTTTSPSSSGRPSTTAGRSSTTAAPSTTAGTPPSTTGPPPTTAASTTTTRPSTTTTARPTTTAPSTTTTAPTTTTTVPPVVEPVFIGDRVSYDDWEGDGVPGIRVDLLADRNGDGRGEAGIATIWTDASGRYGFDLDPGCYVVSFTLPNGSEVVMGDRVEPVCLTSGQSYGRADLVLSRPVAQPPSCNIQIGDNRYAGVEIVDPERDWAPSYAFFDQSGRFILSTSSLGPPDDTTNPSADTIEWTSEHYGYEESEVYSVAAEDGAGNRSEPLGCSRRNV